jgi:uncharacterized radical SAM superfamily Fe-S cluster-containing enzyme
MKDIGYTIFNFEITSYCNAKCPTCFRTKTLDSITLKHLNVDDFEKMVFDNIKFFRTPKDRKKIAKFCGEMGDPLMHPKIDELIYIASQSFDGVEIFTNGGMRRPKWFRRILYNYKNVVFVFGIDGLTDETNQKYRVNVNTDLAFRNMLQCSKMAFTRWDYTIFSHNQNEILDVVNFSVDNNIDLVVRFDGRMGDPIDEKSQDEIINLLKNRGIFFYICR